MFDKSKYYFFKNLYMSHVWNSCVIVVYFAKMFKNIGGKKI